MLTETVTVITVTGTIIGMVAAGLAIKRHLTTRGSARIINPTHGSVNGGRHLTVLAHIPSRRRRAHYWIAIQPDDHRADGVWWPQNRPLEFDEEGYAGIARVRLGREGPDGRSDIDKTFTIGLFEVSKAGHHSFLAFADRDDAMTPPKESKLLNSVDVKRVRQ